MLTHITRALLVIAMVVPLALSAGCGGSGDLQTVNDPDGLFHVRVAADSRYLARSGLIAVYAAENLPQTEEAAFETLSMGIYTAPSASQDPVDERLVTLLEQRAEARGWTEQSIGEPAETTIGGRTAYAVEVSGTDEKSRRFAGRAALVRTSGREVLVFAVSPEADWQQHAGEVDGLFEEWYWHLPADAEASDDATPNP